MAETTETVTVTLFVQVPIDGCADWDEVERTHAVTLDAPLGDRQVQDGACELRGFWDDRRCGTGRGPVWAASADAAAGAPHRGPA